MDYRAYLCKLVLIVIVTVTHSRMKKKLTSRNTATESYKHQAVFSFSLGEVP